MDNHLRTPLFSKIALKIIGDRVVADQRGPGVHNPFQIFRIQLQCYCSIIYKPEDAPFIQKMHHLS